MPVSTFLTQTTEATMIQVIMYESSATRNHHFTLLGQWYYSKDFVCAFLTYLKYHNPSGMAPSTNFLQTYLESAESPLLGTVEISDRCFFIT